MTFDERWVAAAKAKMSGRFTSQQNNRDRADKGRSACRQAS